MVPWSGLGPGRHLQHRHTQSCCLQGSDCSVFHCPPSLCWPCPSIVLCSGRCKADAKVPWLSRRPGRKRRQCPLPIEVSGLCDSGSRLSLGFWVGGQGQSPLSQCLPFCSWRRGMGMVCLLQDPSLPLKNPRRRAGPGYRWLLGTSFVPSIGAQTASSGVNWKSPPLYPVDTAGGLARPSITSAFVYSRSLWH